MNRRHCLRKFEACLAREPQALPVSCPEMNFPSLKSNAAFFLFESSFVLLVCRGSLHATHRQRAPAYSRRYSKTLGQSPPPPNKGDMWS